MLRRILHSTAMLAATVVAYQVYVLAAVPWIEPPLVVRAKPNVSDEEIDLAGQSVTKYQRVLAAYFARDHWSQTEPPIVIENPTGTVMFVLGGWERHDGNLVDLEHFALLIFPTPRQQSVTPPRDAIILEAPNGANLQFDKNFQPERGQFGEIDRGEFPGKITIRSDMRDAGPADDLLVETTDLRMNSKLLFTPNDVRFRLGPNAGGGRELEIRLLEEETAGASSGMKIASVDSLEIRRDVRLRVFLSAGSLLPGEKAKNANRPAANRLGDASQPPVEVICTGPFHFDFIKYVASFDENVEVWQINPDGPSDQMSCAQLDLHFARQQDANVPPERATLDAADRQREDVRWLEPDRIVAAGYPVVIVSPSRSAEVRGSRVELMLRQRKVAIDGGQDVAIAYGPNVIRAPQIHYQHPAADAGTEIGTFRATGPGTLHYVPDPNRPDQVFQAAWQASVELGRYNGQPVLTVAGRPRLAVTDIGQLTADQVRMFLREVETDGKMQPIPDRMNAVGQVEIDSPELKARTRELVANFHVEAPQAAGDGRSSSRSLERLNRSRAGGPVERTYQVQSDQMQLEVALRGRRAAPTTLSCTGNVAFRELPSAVSSGNEPFEVRGGQLTADGLDGDAQIEICGATPDEQNQSIEGVNPPLAQIRARGMTVLAADVHADVGQNRLWIKGPGVAHMMLERDLTGRETAAPTPLELRWQGGLEFDGRTIVVRQNVLGEGPDDRLRCDELAARLASNVDFGKRVNQDAIDVAEVECRGHVALDHKSRDAAGVVSHERMELARLAVNQQSGVIDGDGPGVIRSTHFADQLSALAAPGETTKKSLGSAGTAKLHFLRVDFQQGLSGNLYLREIKFDTRVRTVYGPVDAWEQELDANRPELLPPDTLMLTSDTLRINEDPLTANGRPRELAQVGNTPFGPVQMVAEGNVKIDGHSPARGAFAATADRASYEQAKELFILEGTQRVPATIFHRDPRTGQLLRNDAGKIMYNRRTGLPELSTVRELEFTPGGIGTPVENAVGPVPLRQ